MSQEKTGFWNDPSAMCAVRSTVKLEGMGSGFGHMGLEVLLHKGH